MEWGSCARRKQAIIRLGRLVVDYTFLRVVQTPKALKNRWRCLKTDLPTKNISNSSMSHEPKHFSQNIS